MGINYEGSDAQRFMQFRSTLEKTSEATTDLFNAVSIYIPATLASANIVDYSSSALSATTPIVKVVTLDNYQKVMKGELLAQWSPAFNDGTNNDLVLYLIVFYDTDFAVSTTANSITWEPLTKAFDKLYSNSFFKVMFSEHYNGNVVESDPAEETDYDDSNYFDMALCLAYLCENESNMSACLSFVHLDLPIASSDTNPCWIMSKTRAEETTQATTLAGTTQATRAEYFWGYINLVAPLHTLITCHNGVYVDPIRIGRWFSVGKNNSGNFVGNKLAKVRLTHNKIKPTGVPSWLNADVNENLEDPYRQNLDDKHVAYLISISDTSENESMIIRDRTVGNYPINAYMMAKWVDYNCSQTLANYATAVATGKDPVLCNEATYEYLQRMVVDMLSTMAGTGRLEDVVTSFPPYSEAKVGNSFTGSMQWSANYVDDLESVFVSGTISF